MYYNDSSMLYWLRVGLANTAGLSQLTQLALYTALEAYYWNNGLYDAIQAALYDKALWTEGMKPLRNPAHRVVEFYVAKLWPGTLPGALPIITENRRIVDPIHQVWQWSNWGVKKQLAARHLSLYGDLFIKVATKPDKVYLQLIKPSYVTDFDEDERDYMTWLRLDIPIIERVDGKPESLTWTEVWDKEAGTHTVWKHQQARGTDLSALGSPAQVNQLQNLGIDFIPYVHGKFQDVGEPRGAGSFIHALDKIDEANRQATRLHQMLYRWNKPYLAVTAGGTDPTGRPLPAPRLNAAGSSQQPTGDTTIKDDQIFYLPGNSDLKAMVPPIDYAAALAVLQAQVAEVERDLPELVYYRLADIGTDLSGKAIGLMMAGAVDRVLEVRGNAETALARAHQMALTIGQGAGLFSNIGSYEAGDFEHTFADRQVIPLSQVETAEIVAKEVTAGVPLKTSLRRAGWSEAELDQMEEEKQAEQEAAAESFGQALLAQGRQFDQGKNPPQGPGKQPAKSGAQQQ